MSEQIAGIVGNNSAGGLTDGSAAIARFTRSGGVGADAIQGRYQELATRGKLWHARAVVTAPVIFSTAAATGGPLLYNGTTTVNAVILAMSISVTTASGVATAYGIATGATTAPGSTTAIDSQINGLVSGAASACTAYRVGTPSAAATNFIPFGQLTTAAVTVQVAPTNWLDIGGSIVIPPGYFGSFSVAATATSCVAQIGLMWTEVPV